MLIVPLLRRLSYSTIAMQQTSAYIEELLRLAEGEFFLSVVDHDRAGKSAELKKPIIYYKLALDKSCYKSLQIVPARTISRVS
jgi:hypothetical protein